MTHSMDMCEFGQVHGQCRCPSPVKSVNRVVCDIPEEHRDIFKDAQKAEIDYETEVETLLYRIETFASRYPQVASPEPINELKSIAKSFRELLDMTEDD